MATSLTSRTSLFTTSQIFLARTFTSTREKISTGSNGEVSEVSEVAREAGVQKRGQAPRDCCIPTGDGRSLACFEVRRFTTLEHDQGDTAGWQFTAGWFTRDSGLQWAWLCKGGSA